MQGLHYAKWKIPPDSILKKVFPYILKKENLDEVTMEEEFVAVLHLY